jgi:DNA-binding transcriptional regulator YiaG
MTAHPNRSKRNPSPAATPSGNDWRKLRDRHGLSQSDLAEKLHNGGITVRAIQSYEQEERRAHPALWRYVLAQLGEIKLPE